MGKRALRAHDDCTRALRHHALIAEDVEVGGPCRGALAAMEGRRSAGMAASSAARASGAGHLMISCARTSSLTMCRQAHTYVNWAKTSVHGSRDRRHDSLCVCCLRYQWDVQATVLRIATSMRDRGFNVWMDTEMMSGSTLDAMAAAVEDAHCVLICITERYKARD